MSQSTGMTKLYYGRPWDISTSSYAYSYSTFILLNAQVDQVNPAGWIGLILNYFRANNALSSGVVEGLNNKAKVIMRKSNGFRTFPVLELALYQSLAKLPEPSLTHDFF